MKHTPSWKLMVFYCSFEGWVLSLPLFGPALFSLASLRGLDTTRLATTFLLFFSLSFILWGISLSKWKIFRQRAHYGLLAVVSACLACSLSVPWLPAAVLPAVFALLGLFSGYPSMIWLSMVRQQVSPGKVGWYLGITGLFVESVVYVLKLLATGLPPMVDFYLTNALLVAALLMLAVHRFRIQEEPETAQADSGMKRKVFLLLFLLIFVVDILGGLMYQIVTPHMARFAFLLHYYGVLPYIAAMPFVGVFADKRGIRAIALFGMVGLGLAYTIFAFSSSLWAAIAGNTMMNIGFAFLDLLVLFALVRTAPVKNSFLYVGTGLGIYIFSILTGVWLSSVLIPASQGNYTAAYLVAVIILFIAFLVVEWIGKQENARSQNYYSALDEELQMAYRVQQNMLPKMEDFPAGLDVCVQLQVAREVGGDFYDVIPLSDERSLFVIGDVMGKGLPAALIVSSVVGQIRSEAQDGGTLPELLQHVNRVLIRDARFSMFVTIGLALVDEWDQTVTYASAGHLPPYLIHGKEISPLAVSSLPLGIDFNAEYEETSVSFSGDDLLVLYTDGIIEAKNGRNRLYGFERLEQLLVQNKNDSAQACLRAILSDVRSFSGKKELEDDFTLLIIQTKRDRAAARKRFHSPADSLVKR